MYTESAIDSDGNVIYERIIKDIATNRNEKGKSLLEYDINDFTVIDIETTGLDSYFDEIIELAAIKVRNNEIIEKYQTLIKPYTEIDDFIANFTGITNEMVKDSPKIDEKLIEFFNFIDNDIIIGHNVNFDINFLYDESIKCYGKPLIKNNFIDTMRLARRCIKDSDNHKLNTLAKKYNIDTENEHRALADCFITYKLFNIEKELCSQNPDCLKRHHQRTLSKEIIATVENFDVDNPFYKKEVVFTGTLDKYQRKDVMQIIANLGGTNSDRVTKRTNYLVLGNNDYNKNIKDGKSNKQKDAEKYKLKGFDIETISENVFYDMINDYN